MTHKISTQLGLATGLMLAAFLSGCSGGDDGATGADGSNGSKGTDGSVGANGTDGSDGAKGADGSDGSDGAKGADGVNGTDGTIGSVPGNSSLFFSPVAFPETDAEKREILASNMVTINGEEHDIAYHLLARAGDTFSSGTFGLIVDENGNAIKQADNSDYISNGADYTSLLPVGSKLFSITHFETAPGGMYLSELEQDSTSGELTVKDTKAIDFSSVDGLWVPCAGSVTPWGTHLGSEEYPADAKSFYEAASYAAVDGTSKAMATYFGIDSSNSLAELKAKYSPYHYGFATEVAVAASGDYTVTKHYSMGRAALELAYVMPDQKTVYITDDDTNKGLYMFVADTAGDLEAGELFAVKWIQTSADGAPHGTADLTWVSLGHASSSDIKTILDSDIEFSDIFEQDAVVGGNSCNAGFLPTRYSNKLECLKVKTGMEKAASRLETGRYAAMLGATTEFRKEEGITFDPYSSTLFLAFSAVQRGMGDGTSYDVGGPNHVRLEENSCGAVYALDVAPSAAHGSDYVAQHARALVEGTPVGNLYDGTGYAGNTCSINGIASPDNVTMMPEYGVLIIGEDTDAHQNDVIWAYDLATEKLTRIQTTPYGSETTSPYWYPDVNGFGYMSSVVQHPYGESDDDKAASADDLRAYVGYIGTFPVLN